MRFHLFAFGLASSLMSISAFAEPPIQAGDTLESLSKVKIQTSINGQAGSLEELVASGQIRIVQNAEPQAVTHTDNTPPMTALPNAVDQEMIAQPETSVPASASTETAIQHATQAEHVSEQHTATPSAPLLSSSADLPINAGDDLEISTETLQTPAQATTTNMPEHAAANMPSESIPETVAPAAQDTDVNAEQPNSTEQ
ncbi:hypothetical protein MXL26_07610 [Acinetobacter towneri]|uniref:hypothetical protein n=1 Tax=Acinetobacter towneri TaxID=202956 RepID=UPI002DBC50AD|nr:hypothetical protein [Acinetobacter towneri]MEB6565226.1 hypothetical protein [Acinetobacter towneri]